MPRRENETSGEESNGPVVVRGRIFFPLMLFVATVSFVAFASWEIRAALSSFEDKINVNISYTKQLGRDCLTVSRFQVWRDDFSDANPAIRIPRIHAILEPAGSMPSEPPGHP